MQQGKRFDFDRLSEAEFEQIRCFLETKRGSKRRPIILGPDDLLALKQGRWAETNHKRLSQWDKD
jgi:hypothetical protein